MWYKLAKPEILLLIGTIQALSPYIVWYFEGPNPSYGYQITYLPVFIWFIGYFSFYFGARIISSINLKKIKYQSKIHIDNKKINIIIFITLTIIFIQFYFVYALYGNVPLLAYMAQQSNVQTVDKIQRDALSGQLGLFTLSLFFLNGVILIKIIKYFENNKKSFVRLSIFLILILVELIFSSISGKRQGFMITVFFIFIGQSIIFNNGFKLFEVIPFQKYKVVKLFTIAFCFCVIFIYLEVIANLRLGAGFEMTQSWFKNIGSYYEYGIINLEGICSDVGLGPNKFSMFPFLLGFLRYKTAENLLNISSYEPPLLFEPTAGPGFFGGYIWNTGLIGLIIFSIITGMISKYFYNKSRMSIFHLLVYCQMSWTLFSAHSYNFFFSASYLWAPAALFYLLSKFISCRNELQKRNSGIVAVSP